MTGEQDLNTAETPIKKVELGFGGILFGLVIVAAIIFIFNYFNLINIPFNLPRQQAQINTAQTNQQIALVDQKISPMLEKKAETAGYEIIWQGDPKDTTGRTILTSTGRILQGGKESFGISNNQLKIIGLFSNFQKIPNSNDAYIELVNPDTNVKTKIRIVSKIDIGNNVKKAFSDLYVDDLSLIPTSENNFASEKIFDFNEIEMSVVDKIIKKGDVVLIQLMGAILIDSMRATSSAKVTGFKFIKDEQGIIQAAHVTIRRFGGKNEIAKELSI